MVKLIKEENNEKIWLSVVKRAGNLKNMKLKTLVAELECQFEMLMTPNQKFKLSQKLRNKRRSNHAETEIDLISDNLNDLSINELTKENQLLKEKLEKQENQNEELVNGFGEIIKNAESYKNFASFKAADEFDKLKSYYHTIIAIKDITEENLEERLKIIIKFVNYLETTGNAMNRITFNEYLTLVTATRDSRNKVGNIIKNYYLTIEGKKYSFDTIKTKK